LKHKLGLLRHENLESAGFDEKLQMMGLLDIKAYPSEDLKTVRIRTSLSIGIGEANENGQDNRGEVLLGGQYCTTADVSEILTDAPFKASASGERAITLLPPTQTIPIARR
jgi:hypothetical protein